MPTPTDKTSTTKEVTAAELPRVSGPPALVAPIAAGSDEANTIVLFPVHLEFLAVQVQFHRVAAPGLQIRFKTVDGAAVDGDVQTGVHGMARAEGRVPAGTYICEIEHQPAIKVSTVPEPNGGFAVVLPSGRPYADLRERAEFNPNPAPRKK